MAGGYDAVRLAAAAITAAKSTEPAKIRDALKTIRFDGLTGTLQFDAQGQARPVQSISRIVAASPRSWWSSASSPLHASRPGA